jgi:hypothetical protein
MEEVIDFIVNTIDNNITQYETFYVDKDDDEEILYDSMMDVRNWFKNNLNARLTNGEIKYVLYDDDMYLSNVVIVFIYNNKRCQINEKICRRDYWSVEISPLPP